MYWRITSCDAFAVNGFNVLILGFLSEILTRIDTGIGLRNTDPCNFFDQFFVSFVVFYVIYDNIVTRQFKMDSPQEDSEELHEDDWHEYEHYINMSPFRRFLELIKEMSPFFFIITMAFLLKYLVTR